MRIETPAHVTAGLLFLLAACFPTAIWAVYLFVAMPYPELPLDSAMGQLSYTFSFKNDERLWYVWLAFLPIACVILGIAYLRNLSRSRVVAQIMLGASTILAVVTLILFVWPLAAVVAVPMLWGYRCIDAT